MKLTQPRGFLRRGEERGFFVGRLFVDVDGCLRLMPRVQGKNLAEIWDRKRARPNQPLIEAIMAFLNEHDGFDLIVWSGMGARYAWDAANEYLPGIPLAATDKTPTSVLPGEIVIDDEPIDTKGRVYTPTSFVHWFPLPKVLKTQAPERAFVEADGNVTLASYRYSLPYVRPGPR